MKGDCVMASKKQATKQSVESLGEKATRLFAIYPDYKELHFTSDGLAFASHNSAFNHAKTLRDSKIETIKKQ